MKFIRLLNVKMPTIVGILTFISIINSTTDSYKTFSSSTQLSMKFIRLLNVKMSTIVGILIFISIINSTIDSSKARKLLFKQFSLISRLIFMLN